MTLEDMVRKFLRQLTLQQKVEKELQDIKGVLWTMLMQQPDHSFEINEGIVTASRKDGIKNIDFQAVANLGQKEE